MADLTASPESPAILVIDDEPGHLRTLADILASEGLQPICCETGQAALVACAQSGAHVAILDLRLTDMDGLRLLDQLLQQSPDLQVIIHTGYASLDTAMAAVNRGAFAYVQKMGNVEEVVHGAAEVAEYEAVLRRMAQRAQTA